MDFLTRVDNAYVWAKQSGVYRQAELYRRGETLFMKRGSGFIRLSGSGATSAPKVSWVEIDPGDIEKLSIPKIGAPTYLGQHTPRKLAA